MISVLRQPVSISRRIVVTAPADIWLPLLETSSSTCPSFVNSASVRNRSRLRFGFSGIDSQGSSQSSGTKSQPFASLYMWLRVSTAMFAIAGISQRLSCSAMTWLRSTAWSGSLPSAGTMWRLTTLRAVRCVFGLQRTAMWSSR